MAVRPLLGPLAATSATALTLDTPAQATPKAAVTVTGTYQGNPQSLDYNFGYGWVQASSVAFSGGTFRFTVPGGFATGTYVPQVRDHFAASVTASAGTFVVDPWTPGKLDASPGAKAVFEFNASNPNIVAPAADSTVHSVLNSLNTRQYLSAEAATGGNAVLIAHGSGADGKHRLLQFSPTTVDPAIYDSTTNWLEARGPGGPAGASIVGLANSSNLSTDGAFTTVIAFQIDKAFRYEVGPIWGTLASPGPLQFVQLRYNNASGVAGGQVVDGNLLGAAAQATAAAGWHVLTMIKTGPLISYRLDGQQIATATISSTMPFTAGDFLIGGGFPPLTSASAGVENGVPPPYIGEFQAYSGVLAGTDLASAEMLAGNSIGVSLHPTTPRLVQVVDVSTGSITSSSGTPSGGSVVGVHDEYVNLSPDNLNLSVSTPGWFLHGGGGNDTISVSSGANVLSGGGGTDLLVGGSGTDTFYVDDRAPVSDVWSTLVNFHKGDAITLWGVTRSGFSFAWASDQGASGHTGLTLHVTAAGKPTASVTLAGYTMPDQINGRLSFVFGGGSGGAMPYLYIHADR